MSRIRREEVAFPSSPDPRFGGNMARATEGAQYVGASRDYYGGPSKGSPMHDARYGNYVAPHRVDYTRNAPLQSSGIFDTRKGYDFNPRPNIKGHFQEPAFHKFPQSGPAGAPVEGPWNREYDTPMMRGMGGGLGGLQNDPFDPRRLEGYDPFNNQIFTDPFDPSRLGSFDESKIDLNDIFNRFPGMNLWRLIQELDKRGIEYANRGGLMSLRR